MYVFLPHLTSLQPSWSSPQGLVTPGWSTVSPLLVALQFCADGLRESETIEMITDDNLVREIKG